MQRSEKHEAYMGLRKCEFQLFAQSVGAVIRKNWNSHLLRTFEINIYNIIINIAKGAVIIPRMFSPAPFLSLPGPTAPFLSLPGPKLTISSPTMFSSGQFSGPHPSRRG